MTSGPITVSWLDSLAGVPRPVWDGLAAEGGFYVSHGWLSLQEHGSSSRRRYAVATRDGALVGGLSVDEVEVVSNDFYRFGAVLPEGCAGPTAPMTLVGGRGGYASGFVLDPRADDAERTAAVRALLAEIASASRERGRAAVFFYLQDRFRELVLGTSEIDEPLLARHDATLHLPGSEWSDYLASLSRDRRGMIRREERRFAAAGYSVTAGDLTPWLDEAGLLLANVQRRYGHDADPADMTEVLAEQIAGLGEHVAFLCADDQRLVAFALAFPFTDGSLSIRAVGFDYERLRGAAEYPNLAYYRPIRWAYEHGLRRLHLGIESLHAKTLRGARLAPLWVVPLGWSWSDATAIRRANAERAADRESW
ncbi:MAG TPA: GNAT family N-acetyltransferase [Actinomycetota bacterium]|nr:GNAT family N-acetyltransferase [Actinomycetota bacterium]